MKAVAHPEQADLGFMKQNGRAVRVGATIYAGQTCERSTGTVRGALQALGRGETTSFALIDACEQAYREGHAAFNAVVLQDYARARMQARSADEARTAGASPGALHGIPFSVKESFDVAGWPTTCGDPRHMSNIADQDSDVVRRLRQAGAILVGKTNVPISLRDWQSYNAVYGTTRNPHDPSRTPGGSSGGSAAAVCSGMSFFDVGSDIGSSLRNPAHYCGIFSHKSTHGLVSLRGHGIRNDDPAPAINVAGPLARSAFDLELILRVLAETDLPRPDRPPAKMRVAVLPTHDQAPVDADVSAAIEAVGRELERRGACVTWNASPAIDAAELWRVYVLMLRASTSVYADDVTHELMRSRAADVPSDARDYARLQYVGAALDHRGWLKLDAIRRGFASAWRDYFERYDVLLCPAAATAAFPLNEEGEPWQRNLIVNGAMQPMTSQLFWAGYSGLCGLPSTVAPAGRTPEGLPIGVQIVAGHGRDLDSLRFAQHLEKLGYGYRAPPIGRSPSTLESVQAAD